MSILRVSVVALGASSFLMSLACAGSPDADMPASSSREFALPAAGYLFQTEDGLYDQTGRFVADLGGRSDSRDRAHVISATRDPVMLVGQGVRVARRTGDGLSVDTLASGRVVRAAGSIAVVEDAGGWRVLDATGAVLIEGYRPWDLTGWNPTSPPLYLPEYWWNPDSSSLPIPLCKADGDAVQVPRDCAIVHPDGRIEGPGLSGVVGFTTGTGGVYAGGVFEYRRSDGSVGLPLPDGWEELGRPGASGHLLVIEDPHPSKNPVLAVWSPEGTLTPVETPKDGMFKGFNEGDVARCMGPDDLCRYRFHEGLAPVWIQKSGPTYSTAYIDTSGKIVIGPEPCGGTVLSGPFHEGRALMCKGDGYVLIDEAGTQVAGPYPTWTAKRLDPTPNSYEGGLFFSDGLAAVPTKGGWSYIDREGTVVLAGPYVAAQPFRLGIAWVKQGQTIKAIDRRGQRVFAPPDEASVQP